MLYYDILYLMIFTNLQEFTLILATIIVFEKFNEFHILDRMFQSFSDSFSAFIFTQFTIYSMISNIVEYWNKIVLICFVLYILWVV